MAGPLSLPYSHNWDSFSKGFDNQGAYYDCTFNFVGPTNWALSDTIANQMMGLPTRVGGKTIFQNGPLQHPLSPGLYCHDVRIEGIGDAVLNSNGYPSYSNGFLAHATFRSWAPEGPFQASDDPNNLQTIDGQTSILWCTQELDFETDVITLSNTNYYFTSGLQKVGGPVKIEIGLTVMKLTFHRLPYLPGNAIRSLRGQINATPFLSATRGTVRFRGGRTIRDYNVDGSCAQKVELIFVERDHDWNYTIRPNGLVWDEISDLAGNLPFTYGELNNLIQL